ncbi:MAG: hypothetical protein R3F61_31680 [Myxococcota bacterium]
MFGRHTIGLAAAVVLFVGCRSQSSPNYGYVHYASGDWSCEQFPGDSTTCSRPLATSTAYVQAVRDLVEHDDAIPGFPSWQATKTDGLVGDATKFETHVDAQRYSIYVWFDPPLQPVVHDHFAERLRRGVTFTDLANTELP